MSHITLLSFFRIFTIIPLLHSDGTVSWSHMVAKCFFQACLQYFCSSIPPDFPFFIFLLPWKSWWFHLCWSYQYLIKFHSLLYLQLNDSQVVDDSVFLQSDLSTFFHTCCSSFSLVTYHPCYFVYCFHVPLFAADSASAVRCPLSSVISHVAFYL